jgi:hypothetical protein
MVNEELLSVFSSGSLYLVEDTKDFDDEKWFRSLMWDGEAITAKLCPNGYYSEDSLHPKPERVKRIFWNKKSEKIVKANIPYA